MKYIEQYRTYFITSIFCLSVFSFGYFIYNAILGPPASSCFFVTQFGIPCLVCGGSHSIQQLMHGHLSAAISFNPFVVIIFLMNMILTGIIVFDLIFSFRILIKLYHEIEIKFKKRSMRTTVACILILFWIINIVRYWKWND